MRRIHQTIAVFAATLIMTALCLAQTTSGKKSYTFHGKVEKVNTSTGSLTVNGEKVSGWMDAMTMDYKVDNPEVLKKVKAGDQITATVYEGDMSLHKVQVAPKK
jgi:protein SCO1/2